MKYVSIYVYCYSIMKSGPFMNKGNKIKNVGKELHLQ